jgi:acyl carrier protein
MTLVDAIPPCTDTEKQLLLMWTDILQRGEIGLHDSFLQMGGDSLSAMACISRVRNTFGVELSVEEFFMDDATVSHIAEMIDGEGSKR